MLIAAVLGCNGHRTTTPSPSPTPTDAGIDAATVAMAPVGADAGATDARARPWRGADDHLAIDRTYVDRISGPGAPCVEVGVRDRSVRHADSPHGTVGHRWRVNRGCVSLVDLDAFLRDNHVAIVQCFEDADPGYYAAITIRTVWGAQNPRYDEPRFSRSEVLHARGRASFDVNLAQDCLDGILAGFERLSWGADELPAELDLALMRDLRPGHDVPQPRPRPGP